MARELLFTTGFANLIALAEGNQARKVRGFAAGRMKTQVENVMPMGPATIWPGEPSEVAPKGISPGVRPLVVAACVVAAGLIGFTLWIYLSGLQTVRSLAAQIADGSGPNSQRVISQLIQHSQDWTWQVTAAALVGVLGLCLVAVTGSAWLGRIWAARQRKLSLESEQRLQNLLGQLADARVIGDEARQHHSEMQQRLAEVSAAHAELQRELDQRRQAERSLTQQTQKLERSKDVLEMHVQARAQELERLQRRNALILNSAGECICGLDLQGRITFVNPAAAKITGWKIEEIAGRTEAEVFLQTKPKGAKDDSTLLRNDKGEYLPEQIFRRRDGSTFPVEYVRTPIQEDGKVVGAVVVFKDITERRLAEDKLSHKAAELARSNAELEQFAFVASHDLQEPLRKIQAFGDRLKLKCESVKLDEGRDYLERMQSAAARMQTLINDLLTFSRIIRSSQPFTRVDLQIVTKEVLGDLEHRIERSKARVEVGKLPTIDADPMQMRQLLQNLIGNALKFQPPNAAPVVKVDAQLVTRDQIRDDAVFPNPPPTTKPDDRFCVLTIQDNGIGFEEQYLEKIFAVFQRLHGRSEYEGTGVGLAVCRRITDRHGGLITAQSKLGEGATFIVILPLNQAPQQKEAE